MTLTNDAKAVVALTTRLGSSQRPSLSAQKWHRLARALADSGQKPADIFDRGFTIGDVAVDPELRAAVTALIGDSVSAVLEADDLSRKGVWTITVVDDDYPDLLRHRLGDHAPPCLFGAGSKGLLGEAGLGIVGSRDVSDDGARVAVALARQAATLGLSVVSGGARGVDQLAMNAAFESGTSVIGVLADSLLARIRKPDVRSALEDDRLTLISQQAPAAGFTPGSAMARNKLIYGLSDVTVVVASDLGSGGTWNGATEALKDGNGRVAVWRGIGEGSGNAELERLGATPIRRASDVASVASQPATPRPQQLSLIDHD